MAGNFGEKNVWWIVRIMVFGGFNGQDSYSPMFSVD